jgi:cell division protein FtsB
MEAGRSRRASSRLSLYFETPRGRIVRKLAFVILIVAIAAGLYFLGRAVANHEINTANTKILQYQTKNQKLTTDNTKLTATISELQAQLKSVKAKLEAIVPAENTYNLTPNQSLIVGNGHLTIGLVGSPKNEGIDININGKDQKAAAGDVIDVAPDASTTCQVTIQSFNMFSALIHATCAANRR